MMRWRETNSMSNGTAGGFTLLELVIVLAVIAIAISIVAPSMSGFAKGRATINAAGLFVSTARWARAQAITTGNVYHLNIDTSAGKWWLTSDNGNSTAEVTSDYASYTLPEGVTMTTDAPKAQNSNAQAIDFDPSGRSDPGTVHFAGPRNGTADVACDTAADLYHVLPQNGGR
jgi:type II secretion system protein H